MADAGTLVGAEIEEPHTFVVKRVISRGGMGVVHEAVLLGPEGFEKTVAIKTIRDDLAQRADFIDLFIAEAKLVADLVHQNITQIYKLGRFAGTFYIAMEYVHGVDLRRFIERHREIGVRVPSELGAFVVSRVCRGLAYAHEKCGRDGKLLGVVHRDISPNNIMISCEGEVKITDFGVAKAGGILEERAGTTFVGKVPYVSPEQALCEDVDRRSDLFSLGLVAFELLTGEPAFPRQRGEKTNHADLAERAVRRPRSINPEIPEPLEEIVLKCLQRDRDERYQDASRMAYEIESWLYARGYGPTIVTLERHMRLLFPDLYTAAAQEPAAPEPEFDPTERIVR